MAPTNDDEYHDVGPEWGRRCKKYKQSAAAVDEIDALFYDAIGWKVM